VLYFVAGGGGSGGSIFTNPGGGASAGVGGGGGSGSFAYGSQLITAGVPISFEIGLGGDTFEETTIDKRDGKSSIFNGIYGGGGGAGACVLNGVGYAGRI